MNRNLFSENARSLRFHVLSFPWIGGWIRHKTSTTTGLEGKIVFLCQLLDMVVVPGAARCTVKCHHCMPAAAAAANWEN
jgi:hypothetical protein